MGVASLHEANKSFYSYSRGPMAFMLVFITILSFEKVMGAQHTVGDSVGWGLGNDLQSWASQNKFHVGDDLYFPYPSGQHSVLMVTEEDYKSCNIEKPITSDNGMGDMVITLDKEDTYYFICGVPGHCEQGLHLSIVVEHQEAPPPPVEDDPPIQTPQDSPPHSDVDAPILSPPYYSKYNTFHRNSSPTLALTTLTYASTFILSILCTLASL